MDICPKSAYGGVCEIGEDRACRSGCGRRYPTPYEIEERLTWLEDRIAALAGKESPARVRHAVLNAGYVPLEELKTAKQANITLAAQLVAERKESLEQKAMIGRLLESERAQIHRAARAEESLRVGETDKPAYETRTWGEIQAQLNKAIETKERYERQHVADTAEMQRMRALNAELELETCRRANHEHATAARAQRAEEERNSLQELLAPIRLFYVKETP